MFKSGASVSLAPIFGNDPSLALALVMHSRSHSSFVRSVWSLAIKGPGSCYSLLLLVLKVKVKNVDKLRQKFLFFVCSQSLKESSKILFLTGVTNIVWEYIMKQGCSAEQDGAYEPLFALIWPTIIGCLLIVLTCTSLLGDENFLMAVKEARFRDPKTQKGPKKRLNPWCRMPYHSSCRCMSCRAHHLGVETIGSPVVGVCLGLRKLFGTVVVCKKIDARCAPPCWFFPLLHQCLNTFV